MIDTRRLDQLCYDGKAKVKANGKTYTVRATAYGNWYGYIGTKRTEWFWGDYTDQAQSAIEWLDKQNSRGEIMKTLQCLGRTYALPKAKQVANELRAGFPGFFFDVAASGELGRVEVYDAGSHIFLGVY